MKKIITCILSTFMILSVLSSNAYANTQDIHYNSDKTITQKVYDNTIKEKIEYNDKSYILDTQNKVTEYIRENKNLTQTKTFDNLEEKQVPQTLEIEIEGEKFVLNLSNVQYTEKEIPNGNIDLTNSINFGFQTDMPNISPTNEIKYIDNNKEIIATIPYSSLDKSNEYWKSGFTVAGRYIGDDDVSYYKFNDILIPNSNNDSVPYIGYESNILQSLGINPNKAKIDSANFTNTYIYNGEQVKECVFNLSYLGSDYKANYSDTFTLHKTVYEATATYTLDNANIKTGEVLEYVSATYKPQSINTVLIATTTALILALIIVIILFILKKRKKYGDNK